MNAELVSGIASTATETGVDPSGAVHILGVTLVGVSATTGVKVLFSPALIVVVVALQAAARVVLPGRWKKFSGADQCARQVQQNQVQTSSHFVVEPQP
ncbi:hypothetical protein [Kineococcus sp. R86509]|uniref:hypothetical protein n=1 Tax=Kineococcus sp. R86509 TaxID=3093851 RepID=UPI0036D212E4